VLIETLVPLHAPQEVRGTAIGAIVLAGFGALWLGLGVYFLKRARAGAVAAVIVGIIALSVAAGRQLTRAGSAGSPGAAAAPRPAAGFPAAFLLIVILEFAGIMIVRTVLKRRGRADLILPTISMIVGLHFLPLASILHFAGFYATGLGMIATTAGSFSLPRGPTRLAVACLGTGLTLWATTVALLAVP
jgi:hypothetical protein